MLQRDFYFNVKSNRYRMTIPNPGQIIAIENNKTTLSAGLYRNLMNANTIGGNYALDVIDMHAYLTVLCPDFINDIKSESLLDMDLADFSELKNAYTDQVIPWINSWQKMLNAEPEKTPEDEESVRPPEGAEAEQTEGT